MVNDMNVKKKGWIRIVEAFVAVLLMTGILLIIVGEEHVVNPSSDSDIYDSQLIILRSIQIDASLRQLVLGVTTPVESDDDEFPQEVKDKITNLTPAYLECKAKICEIELDCSLDEIPEKNIYAQSVAITVTKTQEGEMDPKQLKLFCWRK